MDGMADLGTVAQLLDDDPGGLLILDTETTGLDPHRDDVLELSIINGSGRALVKGCRYGSHLMSWPDAEAVNGIRPIMVRHLQPLSDDAPRISGLLRRASVIAGYNVFFDIGFLECHNVRLPKAVQFFDVMEAFAEIYGEWAQWLDNGNGGWRWQKLTTAGRYYDLDTVGAHGSFKDCQLTLEVLKKIVAASS